MKQRLYVKQAVIKNQELQLIIEENEDLDSLEPSGQILVDSDQLAFVYLVDRDGEYAYISIPEEIWPFLKEALNSTLPAYLVNNKEARLHLHGFNDEMGYLIENIKGNSNYGEEMVEKVEKTF